MEFDIEGLEAMTSDIWSSMLGVELQPGNGAMALLGSSPTMIGCVNINGDWAGAVTVACSTELAKKFAGAMFQCGPDDLAMDEVKDAMGELTNMTGGSVKGLVPGENQMGMPAVAEGEHLSLSVPKGAARAQLQFEYEGQPLEVMVYEVA
jgi:chemotaxis protein CheX